MRRWVLSKAPPGPSFSWFSVLDSICLGGGAPGEDWGKFDVGVKNCGRGAGFTQNVKSRIFHCLLDVVYYRSVLGKIVRELTEWESMKKSCWVDMREDKDKEPVAF